MSVTPKDVQEQAPARSAAAPDGALDAGAAKGQGYGPVQNSLVAKFQGELPAPSPSASAAGPAAAPALAKADAAQPAAAAALPAEKDQFKADAAVHPPAARAKASEADAAPLWADSFSQATRSVGAALKTVTHRIEGSYAAFIHGATMAEPPGDIDVLVESMAAAQKAMDADAAFQKAGGSAIARAYTHNATGVKVEIKLALEFGIKKLDPNKPGEEPAVRSLKETMAALAKRPEVRWKDKVALASLVSKAKEIGDAAQLEIAETAQANKLIKQGTWTALTAWSRETLASPPPEPAAQGGDRLAALAKELNAIEKEYADATDPEAAEKAALEKLGALEKQHAGDSNALATIKKAKGALF